MSDFNENDYLSKIFSFLQEIENLDNNNTILIDYNPDLNEIDLDIQSKHLFKDIYNNLLYYYQLNETKNISSNEQKYFYRALIDIIRIIFESNPDFFYQDDIIKTVLIYLINFFKESMAVNLEIVCKMFFCLQIIIENIESDKIYNKESQFETKVLVTIKSCLNKFIGDFEVEIKNLDKLDNFNKIIETLNSLKNIKKPFYLKGFIEYYKKPIQIKLLIIKIYEYIKEINPFKNDISSNLNYHFYQAYSLYEILLYNNQYDIDISDFNNIKTKRIKDNNAKSILELTIKLLKTQTNEEFQKILSQENINLEANSPKISNNFDSTENYYKDLYDQLNYYLMEYKKNPTSKTCKIIFNDYSRVLWLNFNKRLLLNLSQKDIEKPNIKVIFYFIVNLFYPEIDTESSLEFREDTIPILYSQCFFSKLLLDNEEIYRILDKDYSQYYTNSEKKIIFNQMFINIINKKILKNKNVKDFQDKNTNKSLEVSLMLKCYKYLPLPLLQHFFEDELHIVTIENSKLDLFNFYRNCFCDLGSSNKNNFIDTIRSMNLIERNEDEKENLINEIIKESDFIDTLKKIMTSPVVNNAYYIINKFYLSNGSFNQEEEIEIIKNKKIINLDEEENKVIEESKNKNKSSNIELKINESNREEQNNSIKEEVNNLINGKPIISYYNRFCKELENYDYSNIFIIMGLPKTIKGFTFRFLKIIINTKGIIMNMDDDKKSSTLLKAYLIFVIIHEENHFIKRYFNKDINAHLCDTPKINGYNEGGKHLIKLLFGEDMINKNINLEQAKFILKINNWTQKSIYEFRKDFSNIKTGGDSKDTISYLSSGYSSICDHSKLQA